MLQELNILVTVDKLSITRLQNLKFTEYITKIHTIGYHIVTLQERDGFAHLRVPWNRRKVWVGREIKNHLDSKLPAMGHC